jgi:hypothetical protein
MRIRCAKCDKPVDLMKTTYCAFNDAYVIVVECHGEEDEMKLGRDVLYRRDEYEQVMSQEGVAFTKAKLPSNRRDNHV